ncbi:MAG: hypothetical protein JNM72_21255 [Deltaproteobacteria bacterium]|jgi:hypothetical protein|nr:hypothetical protein [Deltaproteobacteria bacterium]
MAPLHAILRVSAPGLAVLALSACAAGPVDGAEDTAGELLAVLLPVDAWRPVEAEAGPFADPPAAAIYCSELSWRVEPHAFAAPMFEVRSDLCLWGVYAQTLDAPLAEGDALVLSFAWGETWAAAPTEAVLGLAVGDEQLWSRAVPVPGPAGEEELRLPITAPHAAGEAVTLLVSNHGTNTWAFSEGVRE